MNDAAWDDFVQRARDANILEVAQAMGARLKRAGANELAGPCPACGGTDRFSINTRERVFNCRGAEGGDVLTMAAHIQGLDISKDFQAVCEAVLDEPAPRGESARRERDPAIERERREERRDDEIARQREDEAKARQDAERASRLFESGEPIEGTVAEDYLDRRGIDIYAFDRNDLRFIPNLSYRGFADRDADETVELGRFHCMVAAVRDASGRIIGVHRTYLDPSSPIKLRPPGDRDRNGAKKGTFQMGGGLIMLQPPTDVFAIAEGIETALSWHSMARVGEFGDDIAHAGIGAAYSLGNLCGRATGAIPHPNPPRGRKNATIMNGEPDMGSAATWVPAGVKTIILLGDGDSDPINTCAILKTGAGRYRRLGYEVRVHMAPAGMDWNDVLLSRKRLAA